MIDVIGNLKTYLDAQWTETDPAKADLKWALGISEFDKVGALPEKGIKGNPIIKIQEVTPSKVRYIFLAEKIHKVEHEVLLTVFVQPARYDDTTLDAKETTFRKMKAEIVKILNIGRYSVHATINKVELSAWTNETDQEANPIVFQASIVIKCTYYEDES